MEFRLSKGHFLGLFCAVVWGATFISTKVLLEYLSPLQILFSRFLLGYIALWCLYPHRSPKYGRKAQLLFALAGFLGTFLYFLMENVALQHTTASNVGVWSALHRFLRQRSANLRTETHTLLAVLCRCRPFLRRCTAHRLRRQHEPRHKSVR